MSAAEKLKALPEAPGGADRWDEVFPQIVALVEAAERLGKATPIPVDEHGHPTTPEGWAQAGKSPDDCWEQIYDVDAALAALDEHLGAPTSRYCGGGGGGGATVVSGQAAKAGEWMRVRSPSDWYRELHFIRKAGDVLTACGLARGTPTHLGGVGCNACQEIKNRELRVT